MNPIVDRPGRVAKVQLDTQQPVRPRIPHQCQVHGRVHKGAFALWRVFAEFGENDIRNSFKARPMPRLARPGSVPGRFRLNAPVLM
jgi:hypothetical protein